MTALYALKYYTYILVYVDDILIFYKDLGNYMAMIEEKYTVNPDSIRKPEVYLKTYLGKVYYPDGLYS